MKEEKRMMVVPGETIVTGEDYLPGEGVRREGEEIVASRFGLAEISGRLVKIIPLSGRFIPRRGNNVIGRIEDITFNGWVVNINAAAQSFLPLTECSRFVNKNDLAECFDIGDMIMAKIDNVTSKSIDLTTKPQGLGKLEEGMIIRINPSKVPRVIGKEGSMIHIIKEKTGCNIKVGQNGIVWIKGNNIEDELFAKEVILFVTERSFVEGLTEKVEEFIEKTRKNIK
jgi:exosome complex component RRP4